MIKILDFAMTANLSYIAYNAKAIERTLNRLDVAHHHSLPGVTVHRTDATG